MALTVPRKGWEGSADSSATRFGAGLREYTRTAGISEEQKEKPLSRAAIARSGQLSAKGLSYVYIWRLVKRRLKDADLDRIFDPHSFRVQVATDMLT